MTGVGNLRALDERNADGQERPCRTVSLFPAKPSLHQGAGSSQIIRARARRPLERLEVGFSPTCRDVQADPLDPRGSQGRGFHHLYQPEPAHGALKAAFPIPNPRRGAERAGRKNVRPADDVWLNFEFLPMKSTSCSISEQASPQGAAKKSSRNRQKNEIGC
jgi:hypothetical protein